MTTGETITPLPFRIRIATVEKHPRKVKVAWRYWVAIPTRGDHIYLKREDIFGTVVSVMWTDEHIAVVVRS